jgi:ABC-type glutathione transport system ATPase component
MAEPEKPSPSVEVVDVSKEFHSRGVTRRAVSGVSFQVAPGETVAVIGESGAGKTTLSRLVAGLERPTSGRVVVAGQEMRLRRGEVSPVQMVFQEPGEAVNRLLSIGRTVAEPIRHIEKRQRQQRVAELLAQVGLDPSRSGSKPSAFSGGQLQRVVLARALAGKPSVLLCDEPTSALDVSVQAQIINLVLRLQEELRFACVLVTHDLPVARVLADRILLLRMGEVVEYGSADDFFREPRSQYGRELLAASDTRRHAPV